MGFTMAEILLSLTIIGVVAAITLPSLTGNINERTWNTQRKALYARMSQAIALMPALNDYGTLTVGTESTSAVDTAAETFVTDGLSKVLKINNICDSEHIEDCGIVKSYTNLAGSAKSMPTQLSELNSLFTSIWQGAIDKGYAYYSSTHINTKAAAFETQNGESILTFYNPYCTGTADWGRTGQFAQAKMCANFIYDLNGNKGPNTVGKDIGFMAVLYPTDSNVVAPNPLPRNTPAKVFSEILGTCVAMDSESKIPNKEELATLFYNKELIGGISTGEFWSSSRASATELWEVSMHDGGTLLRGISSSETRATRCIKR